mgnify:CR=1 FL=1
MAKNILHKTRILAQSFLELARQRWQRPLPWIGGGLGLFLFGVVTAFGTVQDSEPPIPQRAVIEPLPIQIDAEPVATMGDFWSEERFSRGDTFASLLSRLGVNSADFEKLRRSSLVKAPLRGLYPGTTVQARINADGELQSLWYPISRNKVMTLNRDGDDFQIGRAHV